MGLASRGRHVVGGYGLGKALEGDRANLFGHNASRQCHVDALAEEDLPVVDLGAQPGFYHRAQRKTAARFCAERGGRVREMGLFLDFGKEPQNVGSSMDRSVLLYPEFCPRNSVEVMLAGIDSVVPSPQPRGSGDSLSSDTRSSAA